MNITLVAGRVNGAVDQVMQVLERGLAELGVNVRRIVEPDGAPTDLTHYGYVGYVPTDTELPATANVWHIRHDVTLDYDLRLRSLGLSRLVVDDVATLQNLGQRGFANVTQIPLLFDPERFRALPPPTGPFTVGAFANETPQKRLDVVQRACERAGLDCYLMALPQSRHVHVLDPIADVYSRVHVLVHPSFTDTNSLPALEALACGRPVVATHSDGLHRVLRDGVNGRYFDGSVGDLARTLLEVRDDYPHYAAGARWTTFPDWRAGVRAYHDLFARLIEEDRRD